MSEIDTVWVTVPISEVWAGPNEAVCTGCFCFTQVGPFCCPYATCSETYRRQTAWKRLFSSLFRKIRTNESFVPRVWFLHQPPYRFCLLWQSPSPFSFSRRLKIGKFLWPSCTGIHLSGIFAAMPRSLVLLRFDSWSRMSEFDELSSWTGAKPVEGAKRDGLETIWDGEG